MFGVLVGEPLSTLRTHIEYMELKTFCKKAGLDIVYSVTVVIVGTIICTISMSALKAAMVNEPVEMFQAILLLTYMMLPVVIGGCIVVLLFQIMNNQLIILLWCGLFLACFLAGWEFWVGLLMLAGYMLGIVVVTTARLCGVMI